MYFLFVRFEFEAYCVGL